MKGAKKLLSILILAVFLPLSLMAETDYKNVLWDDYISLRDAMYNSETTAIGLLPLQEKAKQSAQKLFTSDSLYVALSRCEYIMGRAYSYEDNKEMAEQYYDKGEELANKALEIKESVPSLLMYAENISQNCSVKGVGYAVSMGTKVTGLAKDVLKLDDKNGAAHYMINAQHIYAPSPFHNYKKGIKEMKALLSDQSIKFQKDDLFNITSAIGYGYMEKKEYSDALEWFNKSLTYYPNNKFVNNLVNEIKNK